MATYGDPQNLLEQYRENILTSKEDFTQELYLITLELISKYNPKASFLTYITTHLRWEVTKKIGRLRKETPGKLTDIEMPFTLGAQVYMLKNKYKSLIKLRVNGATIRDIATLTLSKKSTVYNRLRELRRLLI